MRMRIGIRVKMSNEHREFDEDIVITDEDLFLVAAEKARSRYLYDLNVHEATIRSYNIEGEIK